MKRLFHCIVAALLLLVLLLPAHAQNAVSMYGPYSVSKETGISVLQSRLSDSKGEEGEYVKGRILIKIKKEYQVSGGRGVASADSAITERLAGQGLRDIRRVFPGIAASSKTGRLAMGTTAPEPDFAQWYMASIDESADHRETIKSLKALAEIEHAEPDYIRRPSGTVTPAGSGGSINTKPNNGTDPKFGEQWHLGAAKVPEAWAYLENQGLPAGGSRDVIVAVIDTGVDITHPDLAANIWTNGREIPGNGIDDDGNGYVDDVHGVDVITNSGNPMDDHGHGTHVAGIIAAQAGNNIGGVGVAYNVQIMPIKAAQYSGILTTSDIAKGIQYAVVHGVDVINMSFGGYGRSQIEEDALAVAFGQAVLVAAAGNDGKSNEERCDSFNWGIMYPAAYNWVLGVMARAKTPNDKGDYLASFSNYDCTARNTVEYELMAPGVDITNTLPNGEYAAWDGTSMAAPVVSGIAALVRTKFPDKDTYSSRFIMGQIATTGGSLRAYTPLKGDPVPYNVPDAHAALTTVPKPSLSYLEHWLFDTQAQSSLNDDDGIIDAGEIIDLAVVIRNHWGKADNVTVTLRAWNGVSAENDPYVTMITDTVNYGAVGSFNSDDNGLIYDTQGVITGVNSPFRFRVSPDTPNDHVIPFTVTMSARNGFDAADTTVYTSTSTFAFIVQRGRELPRIISQDTVLTNDTLWLIPDATLIEAGATMTIREGARVQFWSSTPNDPYHTNAKAYLQVEGKLIVEGTESVPVELFPSALYSDRRVLIKGSGSGEIIMRYAKVRNPYITGATLVDHCYFDQDGDSFYDFDFDFLPSYVTRVEAGLIEKSIFYKLGGVGQDGYHGYEGNYNSFSTGGGILKNCLFDSTYASFIYYFRVGSPTIQDNVFLRNYKVTANGGKFVSIAGAVGDAVSANDFLDCGVFNRFSNNAILNEWWNANPALWMKFYADGDTENWKDKNLWHCISNNYWGTAPASLIDVAIIDYNDDFDRGRYIYQPILTSPPETAYPFAVDVTVSNKAGQAVSAIGSEEATFTVTFNRDMDTTVDPQVSFGPDVPMTDYAVHKLQGGWTDPRTWTGTFTINSITGDGYQLIRVAGARAADDRWLVTGDDAGRFRFEIITSGTEAMNLQATGGEGFIDLAWTQNDFDLLAGFNLYKAASPDGAYTRLNTSIIPPGQRSFRDTDVEPGKAAYYKFTVVKTDMTESKFSNIATATPLDTIPPVINHTAVTQAPPGLGLTITADVTDNVAVRGVTLFFRQIGAATYINRTMMKATGTMYSSTIEGSLVVSPGIEYYIEATDGVSVASAGRAEYPYQIQVIDKPVVTSVAPVKGPAGGGTTVTVSGSNFKIGARVNFGSDAAASVAVESSGRISCVSPAHFPTTADITVTNPDGQSGTLLSAFTYESDIASVSIPDITAGQNSIVRIPVASSSLNGLAAADFTVTFDPAVLSSRGVFTGTLTPGWSLAANTATPGMIRVSMASPGGTVTGTGILAYLEFEVLGVPSSSSPFFLTSVSLNDGAIPSVTSGGTVTVQQVYAVSGSVVFWKDGAEVPGVNVIASGDRTYTGQTSSDGAYSVNGLPPGNYIVAPSKTDGVQGISAYDASLVLQHAAGLITLTDYAAIAADVNKSGTITSMDAYYILQKAVDLITLPFPGAGRIWDFAPASRTYSALASDQTAQGFTAILIGDVSGNWAAGETPQEVLAEGGSKALFRINQAVPSPDGRIKTSLWLCPGDEPIYSLEVMLNYGRGDLVSVGLSPSMGDWMLGSNTNETGKIRLAAAGARPISDPGAVIDLDFYPPSPGVDPMVTPAGTDINEGSVPIEIIGADQYLVQVKKTDGSEGTVVGQGINCGTECRNIFTTGTTLNLTALPGQGAFFAGWSGACTGKGSCDIEVNEDKTAVAAFVPYGEKSLILSPSWNLVSLPLQPGNTSLSSVLSGIAGSYQVVWGYANQAWKFYNPQNTQGSTLTTMEAGKGYWIKMTEAKTLSVTGSPPPSSLSLPTGWNLVGYNGASCTAATGALSFLSGNLQVSWGYPAQAWKFYNPQNIPGSTLTEMCPGYGYWIKVQEGGTWGGW